MATQTMKRVWIEYRLFDIDDRLTLLNFLDAIGIQTHNNGFFGDVTPEQYTAIREFEKKFDVEIMSDSFVMEGQELGGANNPKPGPWSTNPDDYDPRVQRGEKQRA